MLLEKGLEMPRRGLKDIAESKKLRCTVTGGCGDGYVTICHGWAPFVMFDVRWLSLDYVFHDIFIFCAGDFDYCYGSEVGTRLQGLRKESGCMMKIRKVDELHSHDVVYDQM